MKITDRQSVESLPTAPEHGGNIHRLMRETGLKAHNILDFSANINPCGPPAWIRSLVNRDLELITHYPDPQATELVEAVSLRHQVPTQSVVAANGTTELLHLLPAVLANTRLIVPVPCYVDYLAIFETHGFAIEPVPLAAENGFAIEPDRLSARLSGNETVIFGNPANPAGTFLEQDTIIEMAAANPETVFIIDEAFLDFQENNATVGGRLDNIITLNSLTKFYAIPGLRLGFGIFPQRYAQRMARLRPQWSVNSLAQKIGVKALADRAYEQRCRSLCTELSQELYSGLSRIPCVEVFPSRGNYFLMRLKDGSSSEPLAKTLQKSNILIRCCGNYQGLDHSYFRVAVRNHKENQILLDALDEALSGKANRNQRSKRKARSLMFQGTSSNAGKSILSAAFCRIFLQDGVRVAPFKAQNMSLNSFVTRDGMEMGRAQVVQAMAAKLDPDWRMNPVLLKPNSDTGSQVIVNGKPVRNMDVKQYHGYKQEAWHSVTKSYDELASQFDCIVLEGAGSPGEVNLKQHDIVNMTMAAYADAPVLLVGDIDRGGVYASFAGIMDVLEEWERRLIAGFVVNKFRGDQSLLNDAHEFIREHTDKQVFGVVPFIGNLTVPQEDSVSFKEGFYEDRGTAATQVEIAVIDLPHISNFTDIDPLYYEPDVNLKIIKHPSELDRPDAVIIPGSKNVAGDLTYLATQGFYATISDLAEQGTVIVGVCGGYQMLGRKMADPFQIETHNGEIEGVGLIDIETVLNPDKTLERKTGIHLPSGCRVYGYEIHHGISEGESVPLLKFEDGSTCGSASYEGRVWGAYLHGIFDEDSFRRWFIDDLRQRKGLPKKGVILAPYNLDESLNQLADTVRSCFDMNEIYRLMEL